MASASRIEAEIEADAARVDALVGKSGDESETRRKKPYVAPKAIAAAVRECAAMRAAKDWTDAKPMHWVALWAYCYEITYGMAPTMTGADWGIARYIARNFVERSGLSPNAFAGFVRWVWTGEKRYSAWLREQGRDVSPIGYRFQFGGKLFDRWRANATSKSVA